METELVERGGDMLVPGEDVEWLDDLAEGTAALDAWDCAFAQVLDTTLEAAGQAEPQAGEDLDLAGHGIALVTELFLGGRPGVRVTQLVYGKEQFFLLHQDSEKDDAMVGTLVMSVKETWDAWPSDSDPWDDYDYYEEDGDDAGAAFGGRAAGGRAAGGGAR